MEGAILTMAERLGVDTLAEGVETEGERQMLTRPGCGHVQGFGTARPLPPGETISWARAVIGRYAAIAPNRLWAA